MSQRTAARLSTGFLVLAALRLLLVVGHEPMLGYANNYDFIRISSWFHLWAAPGDAPAGFDPLAQHPSAPISSYVIDPEIDGGRYYLSSDLIFVGLAVGLGHAWRVLTDSEMAGIDLRVLGFIRALVLIAAGVFVTRRFLARSPGAGVVSAARFLVVIADPVFSLVFNTLYSEFSTVLFSYLSGALTVEVLGWGLPRRWSQVLGLAGSFVLLAFSKVQYAGLPLIFLGLIVIATILFSRGELRSARAWIVLIVLLAATSAGVFLQMRSRDGDAYAWSMRMAAATDTYFGAVLPHMEDPRLGLELLGLPQRCARYVGRNWYDPGMQPPPCPEVSGVPRWKIAQLVWRDPGLLWRAGGQGLPLLQPFVVRAYGQVEGGDYAQADLRWARAMPSVGLWPEALPLPWFAWFLVGAASGILLAIGLLLGSVRGDAPGPRGPPATVLVLGVIAFYCFSSSWVGAGFIDLGRHSLVGQLALLCLIPMIPLQILGVVANRRVTTPTT